MTWERIILNILCVVIALGMLLAAAWALLTGQVGEQGIDGVFLVLVCLFIALLFSVIPMQALRQGKLKDLLRRKQKNVVEEKEPRVAAAASQEQR